MKTILTSVKIWAKTVFLNAFLFAFWGIFSREAETFIIAIVMLIGGFFVTAPLLLFVEKLMRLSIKLPYSIPARIAWLFYNLVILIVFFYLFVFGVIGDHAFDIKSVLPATGVTSVALLIAILTTRKSLNKINTAADSGEI